MSAIPLVCSQQSTTFLALGHDTYEHIFSHIDCRMFSDSKEISKYALICKQLSPIAKKQQYSEIYLSSYFPHHLHAFHDLIKFDWGRQLLSYVKHITFADGATTSSDNASQLVKYMVPILKHVKLVHLRIDMEMKSKDIRQVASAINTSRLRRLDIAGKVDMKHWLPILARVAPSIQTLDLVLTNGAPKHNTIDDPSFPNLRSLILDGSQAWTYQYQDRHSAQSDTYEDEGPASDWKEEQMEREGWNVGWLGDGECVYRRMRPAWRDYNHLETLVARSPMLHRVIQHDVPPTCLSAIRLAYGNREVPLVVQEKHPRLPVTSPE